MDPSNNLFSFRFFPYTPQRSLMILQVTTSSWSWAGFGDSVLPFGRYKCYHWRSKGVKKVLKKAFF